MHGICFSLKWSSCHSTFQAQSLVVMRTSNLICLIPSSPDSVPLCALAVSLNPVPILKASPKPLAWIAGGT